jgi:hypothetical protein
LLFIPFNSHLSFLFV